jgi:N4-gp56 family major capsid protein
MKKAMFVFGLAIAAGLVVGPVGFSLLGLAFLNFAPIGASLGTTYSTVNTTTNAGYVTENSQVKEQLWIERVLSTNGASVQSTPFADGMTGRVIAGKPANDSQLNKAVIEVMNTSKMRGDTINFFSYAGIGGEGATGDNVRRGTEAQIHTGNLQVTIGNQIFSVGYKQSAVDKSMIGKDLVSNAWLNEQLRNLHNKRKNNTIIMRMIQAAGGTALGGTAIGANNLLRPEGVATRDALKTADSVDLSLIQYAGQYLPGLGAMPMDTTQDSGGSVGELFMFFTSDKALVDFESDPTNTNILQYGWDRGANNPIFGGGFTKVRGHGLYRWIHRDHANMDSIGSPLLPRAKLSVALTGANTGSIIQGGGLTAAENPTDTIPQWFHCFSNAPYVMYGGVNNIPADTSTDRYVMILNPTGSYAVYNYRVNDGNKITILARVSIGKGTESNNHPVGALIVECNANGVPFGRSLMLGAQAVVGGIGSINGNPADPQVGVIRKEELDLGNDIAIGVEGCAGYAAVTRAGDGAYPGFVVIEHAVHVPGAPVIS